MSTHKIIAVRSGTFNGMDWEADYEITFEFTPGSSDTYDAPGWDAEVSFISARPVLGTIDVGAFTDLAVKELQDWASDWLAEDGYAEACAAAAHDDELAREAAAALKADLARDQWDDR